MEHKDYRLAAIMYTDIVGFSRMMERDEAGTLQLLRYHNKLIEGIAAKRHGTVIKTIGDAFLIDFRNTVEALQCAMEVQAELYKRNSEPGASPLLLRIGVHLGDIYFFEDDALGDGINIAARLQTLSRPGCICFSQDVYNQVLNKIDFHAEKLGKVSLKNITKEIHAYEIASPNVQFDPKRNDPRPGFVVDKQGDKPASGGQNGPGQPIDQTAVMAEIKKAVLEDTRRLGRRPTVDETMALHGQRGIEAREAIAALAERGLIVKGPATQAAPANDVASEIGKAVEGIARAIQTQVSNWQEAGRVTRQGKDGSPRPQAPFGPDRAQLRADIRDTRRSAVDEKRALREELKRHVREVGTGKWDEELKDSDHFKPGPEELETDFSRYRDKVEARSRGTLGGFIGNLVSFLGVNALIWYFYLNHMGGAAPNLAAGLPGAVTGMWPLVVTLGWFTGIVANLFSLFRSRSKIRELDRMPDMEPEALDVYKKLNRIRDSLASHAASILSVPLLLFGINLAFTPGFWWVAIVSGIMGLSFIGHLASYPVTKRGLVKKFFSLMGVSSWKELFSFSSRRRREAPMQGPYASFYREASATRDEILRGLKADKDQAKEFGPDLAPELDRYVDQVKMLTQSLNEVDAIVASIPLSDLAKDKAGLEAKLSACASPTLCTEYKRSIDEIGRQEKACRDLEDQREVLKLRLSSSVNSLKQLKIDMARMKALPTSAEHQVIEDIRKRASEMAGYLDDLKAGYDESFHDPYAELEKLVADNEAKKRLEGGTAATPEPPAPPPPEPDAGIPEGGSGDGR
ncbi:MAG: hypothetical protein KBB32_07440 [Spirochaetia bacterium]|nr:hypothetical protein [Spirochaetia bacterium]